MNAKNNLKLARKALQVELGREPTLTEVGKRVGVKRTRVRQLYKQFNLDPREGNRARARRGEFIPPRDEVWVRRAKQAELIERDGPWCQACGSERKLTTDHVWPISRGGCNCLDNLRLLCKRCNQAKADNLDPAGHRTTECRKRFEALT